MNKQRDLKREGASLLFDRMLLLIDCYNDEEFKEWCKANGEGRVDYLNRELSDTGQAFLHLKTLMEHFPNREDWLTKSFRVMTAAVIQKQQEELRKQREIDQKAKPPKLIHTITQPHKNPHPLLPADPAVKADPGSVRVTSVSTSGSSEPAVKPAQPAKKYMTAIQYEATISELKSRLAYVTKERDTLKAENAELRKKVTEYESRKKRKQTA